MSSSNMTKHGDSERKTFFASKLNSVQRRGQSFFEKNRHHHTSSCADVRKRFSLNILDTAERNSPSDDINIQLLTPEKFRAKSHSVPNSGDRDAVRSGRRVHVEGKHRVSRKLSKEDLKFVEKTFIKKRYSMCFLTEWGGFENSAFFMQNQQPSTMENRQPKRQKIARCMVRFNALNSSRPRTEIGQPASSDDKKPRCVTYYEKRRSKNDVLRTSSDPDVYRSQLQLTDLEDSKNEEFSDDKEVYTTYTAVGSSEDIHSIPITPRSVQELLNNFEDKRSTPHTQQKPLPIPRKVGREVDVETNNKSKPKSSPRPFAATNISKELSDKLQIQQLKSQHENSPSQHKVPGVSSKTPPLTSPKPKAPKPIPKVKLLTKVTVSEPPSVPSTETPRTDDPPPITKPLEVHNQLYNKLLENNIEIQSPPPPSSSPVTSPVPEQDSSDTKMIKENTTKQTFIKQTSTKQNSVKQSSTKQPNSSIAYAVVTLQPDDDMSGKTQPDKQNYESVYLEADNDIVPQSSATPMSPNDYLTPVDAINDGGASEHVDEVETVPVKEKRKKYKKAGISKSMAEKKSRLSNADELKRRQSLPDFVHGEDKEQRTLHEYEDIDFKNKANVDDVNVVVTSPTASDEEGWNSDEFDSSSADEEEEQPIPKLAHLEGTNKKLYQIVTEILTTERAYVKKLHLLDQVFYSRIQEEVQKDPSMMPEKVLKEIFPNLSPIYKFHSTILLPAVEERIKEWEKNDKIGDIFKTLGHCLLLYTEYVKKFDHATTTLNYWLKKSPKFASLIQELQKDARCENLFLQHHMLGPIQRVPRYKLLLADYLKRLPEDSPDRTKSEESLVIISKAAENANNSMKENEKFNKLLEIEDRIVEGMRGETLVLASRVFLREGELTKLAARSGNPMPRTIILFNDQLLCCQLTPTGKLRVRQIMDLFGLTIIDDDPELPAFSFRIKSKQKVLDLTAQNEEGRVEWVDAIRDAVNDTENRRGSRIKQTIDEEELSSLDIGQQAPLWVKDEFVSMCMLCALKFGLIHRKHHCRGCGRVVCGKCSGYHAVLAYAGPAAKRVCYSCSQKLGIISAEEQAPNVKDKFKDSVRKRDSDAKSDFHGEIFWKAPGKEYKKEWLFLSEFVLYVQKRRQDVKALCTLPVPGFAIESISNSEECDPLHPFCVKLHKPNKKGLSYYIASDNEQLIEQWKQHLEAASQATKYEPEKKPTAEAENA